MKNSQALILLILSLLVLSSCNQEEQKAAPLEENTSTEETNHFVAEYDWPIASFEATNQAGEPISLEDLKGQTWVMNMIFTNCETVCLPMTANMAKLQQQLKEENLDVRLISFSVDPLFDTPDKLKDYALQYNADFSNWDLLTGYTEDDIKRIAKSVKTLAEKPEGTNQVTHSTKFFLVTEKGVAVKGYNGTDVPFDEIIQDIKSIH